MNRKWMDILPTILETVSYDSIEEVGRVVDNFSVVDDGGLEKGKDNAKDTVHTPSITVHCQPLNDALNYVKEKADDYTNGDGVC